MSYKTYYHITPMSNLESILQTGLEPRIGERSKELGENEKRVYLFHSIEDMNNALGNWLGECFEDEEIELAIIELQVPDEYPITEEEFYESYSYITISPEYFSKVYDEYMNEIISTETITR